MNRYTLLAAALGLAVIQASAVESQTILFVGPDAPGEITRDDGWDDAVVEGRRVRFKKYSAFHRRPDVLPDLDPPAQRQISSFAVAPDGTIYLCSGLDPYIFSVRDGVERLFARVREPQVRHVAYDRDTLYASVVNTPSDLNNLQLEDGRIHTWPRFGEPKTYLVRQDQMDHGFYGAFTVNNGQIYLATSLSPSAVYELRRSSAVKIADVDYTIVGLFVYRGGDVLATKGDPSIPRITNNDRTMPGSGLEMFRRQVQHMATQNSVDTPRGSTGDTTSPARPAPLGTILGRLASENPWGMIVLHRANGDDGFSTLRTTTIDADGRYAFANLEPGTYFVTWDEGRAESGARALPVMQRVVIDGNVARVDFRFE